MGRGRPQPPASALSPLKRRGFSLFLHTGREPACDPLLLERPHGKTAKGAGIEAVSLR